VRCAGRDEQITLHRLRASSDRWRVWVTVVSTTKAFPRHDFEPCQPGLFAKSGPISHITPFSIGSRPRRSECGLAEKPLAASPLLSASERLSRYVPVYHKQVTSMDKASKVLAQSPPVGVPRSYRVIADHSRVPHSTLHHRAHGRRSIEEKAESQRYLTPFEEKAVVDFILHMAELGTPVRIKYIPSNVLGKRDDHASGMIRTRA
jgi:hypothetical protein